MSKLDTIIDAVNRYLVGKSLPRMPRVDKPEDRDSMDELMEAALRSVWYNPDPDFRDEVAVEIGQALKKYSGGRNMTVILDGLRAKLDAEEKAAKAKRAEEKAKAEQARRMADPSYVPSFDELIGK